MYIPTRENLQEALIALLEERSPDSVTVKMVCQRAGVSRQALYNHYYCLPDVFHDTLFRELEAVTADCNTYLTWAVGFREILQYLEGRKAVILHVFHSSWRDELLRMLEQFGSRLVSRGIAQCAADLRLVATEQDKTFLLRLYMYAFMGVVRQWLEEGMRLTPEYIADRCEAVMHRSIRETLRRLERDGAPQPVDSCP